MQGKGLVKFFAYILIAVCLYQFLLMIPTRIHENKARAYGVKVASSIDDSELRKIKEVEAEQFYLDSISDKKVLPLGIKNYTYQELKQQQLALGLDLQGGMSVVMQVDLKDLIRNLAGPGAKNRLLSDAVRKANELQTSAQDDFVTLFGKAWEELNPNENMAQIFQLGSKLRDKIDIETSNEEVLKLIREESNTTVKNTFNLLKERIDKFGVTQPNVSLDETTDRITVELPGVRNPEAAKNYLQSTAKLEFWETYTSLDIQNGLFTLNQKLDAKEKRNSESTTDTLNTSSDSLTVDSLVIDSLNSDSSQLANDIEQDQGPLLSILEPFNGGPVLAFASVGDTSKIMSMLRSRDAKGLFPKNVQFGWSAKATEFEGRDKDKAKFELYALKGQQRGGPALEGGHVTEASAQPNVEGGGGYRVILAMDQQGGQKWAKLTDKMSRNVNTKVEYIAVVLDGNVYSAPTVRQKISGGNTEITGNFSSDEANRLANILNVGQLPAKPEIIEQAVVGPTLGATTIRAGLFSLLLGLGLVLLFMAIYYGGAGIISIIALFANLFFIIGSLASLGTVLTLPGIAGIVLTIGMAVDANVIIYERIREELRNGKALEAAIRDGFKYSYSAIIDANVTTFIVAIILSMYGLGPIKGFAVVLMVGVLCSVFAAVLIGRLMFDYWMNKGRKISFSTNSTRNLFSNMNIDWVGKRKIAYVISSIVIIAGIVSMFARENSFEFGVDFKGGRSYTVYFENGKSVETEDLSNTLKTAFEGETPVVKLFNRDNQVKVTTSYLMDGSEENADDLVLAKLFEGCKAYGGWTITQEDFVTGKDGLYLQGTNTVGATVADDIRQSAFKTSILALLFIFLYILFRFRKWQYSLGAVGALFHDVLVVLGVFSIFHGVLPFSMEVDQAFIAAILTVIGYSINDTVVVFDRIREFMDEYKRKPLNEVVNMAVNQTVSRTIITSLTTLLMILMLFLFGGESIRGFAFAIVIGVLVGTYSSVFIATPIVVDFSKDNGPKDIEASAEGKYTKKVNA